MGGQRMDRRITEAEFERRVTREHTGTIALQCLFCGNIDEVAARFSDGRRCSACGRQVVPAGYLKPEQAGKKPTQHEAAEQEALFRWAAFIRGRFPEIDLLYHLYIEMKAGKNTTTEKQDGWISDLRMQGYAAEVCYGWERAAEVITKYLESGVKNG